MIDVQQFDDTLRRLVRPETFVPFRVELEGGRHIWIRQPALAFGGGEASFIDPEDGALVDFTHDRVVGFHLEGQETRS